MYSKKHFSKQQIKTFTDDVNNTIIMTREIVEVLRNTTRELENRVINIQTNNIDNSSEVSIIQQP